MPNVLFSVQCTVSLSIATVLSPLYCSLSSATVLCPVQLCSAQCNCALSSATVLCPVQLCSVLSPAYCYISNLLFSVHFTVLCPVQLFSLHCLLSVQCAVLFLVYCSLASVLLFAQRFVICPVHCSRPDVLFYSLLKVLFMPKLFSPPNVRSLPNSCSLPSVLFYMPSVMFCPMFFSPPSVLFSVQCFVFLNSVLCFAKCTVLCFVCGLCRMTLLSVVTICPTE
jgi:hypothetical protein